MSEQSLQVQTFVALLRGYASTTRQLNAELIADHGLTMADYDVLLHLAWAPDRRMRRVDLAEQVLLTASGVTRLLDGLERGGFVERASCDTDRRVVYAVLTESGLAKLREASGSHVPQVEAFLTTRFDDDELAELRAYLERLADGETPDCSPPA